MFHRINPFDVLRTTRSLLRQTNSAKAVLLISIAFLLQTVVGFGPIALGLWFLFHGEYLAAILGPLIIYVAYGLYLAFWPILALINLIAVWIEEGFLVALLSTLSGLGLLFILFSGPNWLIYLANRYAEQAARFEDEKAESTKGYTGFRNGQCFSEAYADSPPPEKEDRQKPRRDRTLILPCVCGEVFRSSTEHIGKAIRCPSCGRKIMIQ